MGSGIAQSCATTGKFNSITLQDTSQEQLDKAKLKIATNLAHLVGKKRIKIENAEEVASRIQTTTQIREITDKNLLVIEAVPEILEVKQNLFKYLTALFKGDDEVILATNTSSLSVNDIGKYVEDKPRFAGLHFFSPVPLMKLVEIVRQVETSQDTFDSLQQFVTDIDKVGVSCKDTPGFIVNRLLIPYSMEAMAMLERGDASARDIDTAMKLGAGYPMGPFELADFVGLDVLQFIAEAWGGRGDPSLKMPESKLLKELVAKGHLGKKTGKGFYDWSSGTKK